MEELRTTDYLVAVRTSVTWGVVVGTAGTWGEGLGEINVTVLLCVCLGVGWRTTDPSTGTWWEGRNIGICEWGENTDTCWEGRDIGIYGWRENTGNWEVRTVYQQVPGTMLDMQLLP